MKQKKLLFSVFALAALSPVFGNQAPKAIAGPDITYKINYTIRLQGDATDDNTAIDLLTFAWRQISGPAQSKILSPETQVSRVIFPQTGEYLFQLTVCDNQTCGVDTVKYTIIDSLPFIVLNPVNNEEIQIGKPYTIRWRMDPSRRCRVEYSLNDGVSFKNLSVDGAAIDTFVWRVDSSFIDSARVGIVKISEYNERLLVAFGSFTLVEHPSHIVRRSKSLKASPLRISFEKTGNLAIWGLAPDEALRLQLLWPNGKILLNTCIAGNSRLNVSRYSHANQPIICTLSESEGGYRQSMLLNWQNE